MAAKFDKILSKLREADAGGGGGSGVSLAQIQAAIDAGTLKIVFHNRWIPAFSILPTKTNAAYYLNDDKPGRVFSDIAKDGMRIILSADEIPEGTTGIKVKIEAHHFDTGSPADRDVAWEMKAGWYNGKVTAVLGSAVILMQTLDADNTKTAISAQSGTVAINGTEGTDDSLELTIHRDYNYSSGSDEDDLASECKITRVNLEFITT